MPPPFPLAQAAWAALQRDSITLAYRNGDVLLQAEVAVGKHREQAYRNIILTVNGIGSGYNPPIYLLPRTL